jgi:hypothetical protein
MNYPDAEQRRIYKGNETPQAAGVSTFVRPWRIKTK